MLINQNKRIKVYASKIYKSVEMNTLNSSNKKHKVCVSKLLVYMSKWNKSIVFMGGYYSYMHKYIIQTFISHHTVPKLTFPISLDIVTKKVSLIGHYQG